MRKADKLIVGLWSFNIALNLMFMMWDISRGSIVAIIHMCLLVWSIYMLNNFIGDIGYRTRKSPNREK